MSLTQQFDPGLSSAGFASLMERLGPFEPQPFVAVAVSGGADSLAAAVLTAGWARLRGGDVLAMVVDHGLRSESAAEAVATCVRLAEADIASVCLTLEGLARGPGIAARARAARHAVLEAQCAARGIMHLVFGHHVGDQAETVAMRMVAQSGPAGLSGMAALVETPRVRRLRPLLGVAPGVLRAVLQARGIGWIEDPSNHDPSQQRARLRELLADPAGTGRATRARSASSAARGEARAVAECAAARVLAARAMLHPAGFAVLSPGPIAADALARLLGMIAGADRPPPLAQVATLAAAPRAATIGGVRILAAGRLGPGWLLVREAAAMAAPVPARRGARWDGRYRLTRRPDDAASGGLTLGAWGADARAVRGGLPACVLETLPVLRRCGMVVADWTDLGAQDPPQVVFDPPMAAAGAPFFPLPKLAG